MVLFSSFQIAAVAVFKKSLLVASVGCASGVIAVRPWMSWPTNAQVASAACAWCVEGERGDGGAAVKTWASAQFEAILLKIA